MILFCFVLFCLLYSYNIIENNLFRTDKGFFRSPVLVLFVCSPVLCLIVRVQNIIIICTLKKKEILWK